MAKQTFTTGQVLTAAQMTSLQQTAMGGGSATAKTASYVLVAADAGTTVAMNAAGATTITVNTGLFAAGDTVFIQNLGAGNCTVTAGTATVATAGSAILPQNDAGILYFTATGASIFYDFIQAGAASPLTTKGDLYGFSTLDARIPIGANGTLLTADSTESLGLKWAAASGGGSLTKISATSFSAVSSISLPANTFTSTYDHYKIMFMVSTVSADAYYTAKMRASGTDDSSAVYGSGFIDANQSTSSLGFGGSGATQTSWSSFSYGTNGSPAYKDFNIYNPFASVQTGYSGFSINQNASNFVLGGRFTNTTSFDSMTIFRGSGTMTGKVTVYGYEK